MLITAILFNFKSKLAQSSIVSYFRVISYVFYDYRKLFMSLFFTQFVKLDPDPQKMNADPQPWIPEHYRYRYIVRMRILILKFCRCSFSSYTSYHFLPIIKNLAEHKIIHYRYFLLLIIRIRYADLKNIHITRVSLTSDMAAKRAQTVPDLLPPSLQWTSSGFRADLNTAQISKSPELAVPQVQGRNLKLCSMF